MIKHTVVFGFQLLKILKFGETVKLNFTSPVFFIILVAQGGF